MQDLTSLTLLEARQKLDNKEFTSVELTQAYLSKIDTHKDLNCYITLCSEKALESAKKADQEIQGGNSKTMTGIPLGIKDLFCTKGIMTSAASHILDGFTPEYESTITQKFLDQNAVFLGKLNMDEFAMGSANETSYYGTVINPWKNKNDSSKRYVAGGSSGGSAAAVAADLCIAATGTDTGGSIRQPAAFTGIVGLKPTYGRCSRYGIIAFASSLDQAGPMTKTVTDSAVMLHAMAGYDPKDSTSSPVENTDYMSSIKNGVKGLRIGIPKEYFSDDLPKEIINYWQKTQEIYRSLGAEIKHISLPHTDTALPAYYIIAPAEASSNLARYDGVRYGLRVAGNSLPEMYMNTRTEGFGDEVKRRIMIGTFVLSSGYYDAYYKRAQKVRRLIRNDFETAFQDVDVILTPTTPSSAFEVDQKQEDPKQAYFNDVYTVSTNLSGLPALSLPIGVDQNGLPLGMQLIGRSFDEATILRAAYALEKNIAFRENYSINSHD